VDLGYHSPSDYIYASIGDGSGPFSHSLLPLSPSTGAPGAPLPAGPQPGKLLVSPDNEHLYFSSETNGAIRRWNFSSNAIDLIIPIKAASAGLYTLEDFEFLPNMPGSLVVLRAASGCTSEITVYDGSQMRPVTTAVSLIPAFHPSSPMFLASSDLA